MASVVPSVAVVLTCYNEGQYIGAAVRSIIDQTRADLIDSIVIADDGSDTETLSVLRQIEKWDPRIKILYGTGGAGLPAQRNRAIAQTSAPLIAILDGDDIWATNKIELQTAALAANPTAGLVYSGYSTFASEDLSSARRAAVQDISAARCLSRTYFLNDPPIIPSAILLRRAAFDSCGGFDPFILVFEDTDLYLRLARTWRFAFCSEPLLYKRNRGGSITGGRSDLMAWHAYVALKAAAEEPKLLPLVPRRLAERARKLGNVRFLMGNTQEAKALLQFATKLDPINVRAWVSRIALSGPTKPILRLIRPRLRSRRLALGSRGHD